MTSQQIRDKAALSLKGRMPLAVASSLILGMLCSLAFILADSALYICGLVDYDTGEPVLTDLALKNAMLAAIFSIMLLLWILLVMPVKVGVARWFFGFSNGENPPLSEVFYAFSKARYVRTLDFCIRLFLKKLLYTLPCVIPGALLSGFGIFLSGSDQLSVRAGGIYAAGIMLFAAGFIASRFICLRYFAANYVLASSDTVTGKQAVRLSVDIMRGRKSELAALVFSHTGWFLLTVPTIGLSLLYVVPRYNAALAIFAKDAIDGYLYNAQCTMTNESRAAGGG